MEDIDVKACPLRGTACSPSLCMMGVLLKGSDEEPGVWVCALATKNEGTGDSQVRLNGMPEVMPDGD